MQMDFSLMAQVQTARQAQTERRQRDFDSHLQCGLAALKRFQQEGGSRELLLQAVTELREALSFQRGRVEPYAYLAWAMFAVGQLQLGFTYLKAAKAIDPDYFLIARICRSIQA